MMLMMMITLIANELGVGDELLMHIFPPMTKICRDLNFTINENE